MPRVHELKARKDYPAEGIKKGETYYKWSLKTGPRSGRTYRSRTRPRPSQLTSSEFLSEAYALKEEIEAATAESVDDLRSQVDDWVGRIEEIRDTTQEKFDNLPEGFQQGETGQLLEERISAMDEWVSELQNVELEELDAGDLDLEGLTEEEKAERIQEHLDELLGEIQGIEPSI